MTKQQIKDRGFTIIEVVLVLAIAALIFLMVFIALPALQASQRDTGVQHAASEQVFAQHGLPPREKYQPRIFVPAKLDKQSGPHQGKTLSLVGKLLHP